MKTSLLWDRPATAEAAAAAATSPRVLTIKQPTSDTVPPEVKAALVEAVSVYRGGAAAQLGELHGREKGQRKIGKRPRVKGSPLLYRMFCKAPPVILDESPVPR
jgi:hypothetical protein